MRLNLKISDYLAESSLWRNPVSRQTLMVCADAALISVSFLGAVLLRFEGQIPEECAASVVPVLLTLIAVRLVTFQLCGLYKWSFVYASVHDFLLIVRAVVWSGAVCFVLIQVILPDYSRAVRLVEMGLCLVLVASFRYCYRLLLHSAAPPTGPVKKVLIYGAGDCGEMLAREMKKSPDLGCVPVGFIEDDPALRAIRVHSIEVLGGKENLPRILRETGAEELIIAIPSVTGSVVRSLIELCGEHKVRIKKVSSLQEILSGRFNPRQLREVALEDLLGREPVHLNTKEICSYLQGKVILVTGAAGSIGSELCRQVLKFGVKKVVLLDHNENKSHLLMLELRSHCNREANAELVLEIADIRDKQRIERIFREHQPEVVFHAAAHKHVPLMEQHPEEAVKTNVVGTEIVAGAAHDTGAERFIMISTDKAVNPVSAMGITKRLAEYIVREFSLHSRTKFNSVRFGNVLGSDGSVIPIFKEQIARGGPVTVTHPEARRYFMTIPESVQLVIQAAALGTGGEIFILDMGEPVRVLDLARDLITLSGLIPEHDIGITFVGLRPGEKLLEELLTAEEGIVKTRHEKVMRVSTNGRLPAVFYERMKMLKAAAEANDKAGVRGLLKDFVRQIEQAVAADVNGHSSVLATSEKQPEEAVAAEPQGA